MIRANIRNSLYIVDYITDDYTEKTLQGTKNKQTVLVSQPSTKVLQRYKLYHRRFSHLGPGKLRYLHERTTLEDRLIIPENRGIYNIYKLTKIRNKIPKRLMKYKTTPLERIYFNIYRLLPILL